MRNNFLVGWFLGLEFFQQFHGEFVREMAGNCCRDWCANCRNCVQQFRGEFAAMITATASGNTGRTAETIRRDLSKDGTWLGDAFAGGLGSGGTQLQVLSRSPILQGTVTKNFPTFAAERPDNSWMFSKMA